jgi:mRNA interferase HicA
MNANQFGRWLKRQHGIKIENLRGTGHKSLINPKNGNRSQLPMHGKGKELGTGLMKKIMKQLGLE